MSEYCKGCNSYWNHISWCYYYSDKAENKVECCKVNKTKQVKENSLYVYQD